MQRNPAAAGLDRKFGALYDKIYREDVIAEAWKRVRANKGAPGVDRQDFDYIENEIGVDQFLFQVREQLKSRLYKPQPVLRCYIEKPGKPEKRSLGIPVIFDRVCQMATKLVIEQSLRPIFWSVRTGSVRSEAPMTPFVSSIGRLPLEVSAWS
jgi:retron-type reverse transcriptase